MHPTSSVSSLSAKVSVIVECVVAIAVILVGCIFYATILQFAVERQFFLDDNSISYDYKEDQIVPNWLMYLICAVTILIPLVFELIHSKKWLRFLILLMAYVVAAAPMVLLLDFTKVVAARLRPDFLSRCQPNLELECQGDPAVVLDGRTSFPSGHTTSTFYTCASASIYLWRVLAPFAEGKLVGTTAVIAALPLLVSWFVALSRSLDNRHHPTDILGGVVLGSAFAGFASRLWNFYRDRYAAGPVKHWNARAQPQQCDASSALVVEIDERPMAA
eukprot:gnl/Chilomastix_cuspidata/1721.p1 GENE.gnl/Chilomastix_cuspidata/1721~~gnl/Chilomastix_cuspidata/1721.p1  ORF type:complete len:275 (+),score=63.87 gnl/Chilomastix_cuspidata/1721:139-963(+)